MLRRFVPVALALVLLTGAVTHAAAAALGTAFTYQGSLNESGSPATGLYDLTFALYDAASAGAQVGSTITVNDANVVAGVFTVNIDFGVNAFNDQARWLEIAVRPGASVGAYTTLAPRQAVTAAPVAQYALNGGFWRQSGSAITNSNTNGLVLVNRTNRIGAEFFGIEAPVLGNSYGGMYIDTQSGTGLPFYGYATAGHSNTWTYLDGGSEKWYLNHHGIAIAVDSTGRVGMGTLNPATRLDVLTSTTDGIHASSSAAFGNGVQGTGLAAGLYGVSSSSDGAGVKGHTDGASGSGVWGEASQPGAAGVAGYDNFGTGVYGQSTNGYAIYGSAPSGPGWAGYFNGNVHVAGTLSKSSGSFIIDHPLDPANKTLSHSFVESPDMMNLYNGNVVTDAEGRATITLPDWFEALNRDFRYQLTPLGQFAQAMVESEVHDHQFVIRTDKPNVRVSWQVSGVRHDLYAVAHPIVVEQAKSAAMRGKFLFPEGYAKGDPSKAAYPEPMRAAAAPSPADATSPRAARATKGTR